MISILGYLDWGLSMSGLSRYPKFKLGYLCHNKDPNMRKYNLAMLLIYGILNPTH